MATVRQKLDADSDPDAIPKLEQKLDDIRARIRRLLDVIEKGLIDDDSEVASRMLELKTEKNNIENQLEDAQRNLIDWKEIEFRPNIIERTARKIAEKITTDVKGLGKRYLKMLVESITLHDDKVEISGSNSKMVGMFSNLIKKRI